MAWNVFVVFCIFFVSGLAVIALNPDGRSKLSATALTFILLLPRIVFILFIVYLFETNFQLYDDVNNFYAAQRKAAGYSIEGMELALANFVVTVLLYIVLPIIFLVLIPIVIGSFVLDGPRIPRALSAIAQGWLYLIRQMFYLVTKPADARRLKRSVTHTKDWQKAALEVEAVIHKERVKAMRSANHVRLISLRRWLSHLKIMGATHHYDKLAKYIHSLNRVGDATSTHITESRKHSHDKERR